MWFLQWGFKAFKADPSMFSLHNPIVMVIMLVYVDDIIVTSPVTALTNYVT